MDEAAARLLRDRYRYAREGAAVERCHQHPHSLRYSVGHHSLDMVTLITLAWQADHLGRLPRAELLASAAFHDVWERTVGDVPSPVKRLDGVGDVMAPMELAVEEWMGLTDRCALTKEEHRYLRAADQLEAAYWSREEGFRGNRTFEGWYTRADLDAMSTDWPDSLRTLARLLSTEPMARLRGLPVLTPEGAE